MALLLFVLWATCTASLRAHVHRLPPFQHASAPLVAPETFRPAPYKSPLPHGLSALLLPTAGSPHRDTGPPPPPGPVEVWCGLRRVGVRVDRVRMRHWSDPRLFRLSSCGVSAATRRFLYFHRGLKECGTSETVVGGQLVYTFTLTYSAPQQGPVLRTPPLNMLLTCHYNRFHYSYKVGFLPQAAPSTFLKSMRSESSFSLSICNSQWEVVPPGHHFLLGEPVFFVAQAGAVREGEQLYVDSCHVTGSNDPTSAPGLDIITNFGCMVDSVRADSSSHFYSRGPSELRFSVDSLVFRPEEQMLFLHCSMSVGLQPSPSSKSCTFNKALGRWLELEASPLLCSCCDSVCVDQDGADSSTVSSAAWHMSQPLDQLYHHHNLKSGPGLHQGTVSLKSGQGLNQETVSLKSGQGLNQGTVSLRSGQGLNQETVSLKKGEADLNHFIKEDLDQGHVSRKSGVPGRMENSVDLEAGKPDFTELHTLTENSVDLEESDPDQTELTEAEELHSHTENSVDLEAIEPDLTELTEAEELHSQRNKETQHQHIQTSFQGALFNPRAAQNRETSTQDQSTLTNPTAAQNTEPQDDKTHFQNALMNPTASQNIETQLQTDKKLFQNAFTNPTADPNTEKQLQDDKTLFQSALLNPTTAQKTKMLVQTGKKLIQSALTNPTADPNAKKQPQDKKTLFQSAFTNPTADPSAEKHPQDEKTQFRSALSNRVDDQSQNAIAEDDDAYE